MAEPFVQLVRQCFGAAAASYDSHAQLQAALAWRLAHHCRDLTLPAGPRADLGAGTGLVGRALARQRPSLTLLQLDLCPELLARNPLSSTEAPLIWDLNGGLPPQLQNAALLLSNFALQWLEQPVDQWRRWCRQLGPGGWIGLAVPTGGSFPSWRTAAAAAGVPCTALALPDAAALVDVAEAELQAPLVQQLRFSRPGHGLTFLRQLKALGAQAQAGASLSAPDLRRLLRHWPESTPLQWEVLLVLGQRPDP